MRALCLQLIVARMYRYPYLSFSETIRLTVLSLLRDVIKFRRQFFSVLYWYMFMSQSQFRGDNDLAEL